MGKRGLSLSYALLFLAGIIASMFISKDLTLTIVFGFAIVFGALIIAWAAEASEIVISQSLALAIVAWFQVFPEVMIESTIAWARDIPNMLANFTGANRILVGVGWPLVFFTASIFRKKKYGKFLKNIVINNEHSVEVIFFLIATIYTLIPYFRGKITILDSIVLASLYIFYLYSVSKLPHLSRKKSKHLIVGIPRKIISFSKKHVRSVITLMLLAGGLILFFVAEPFYQKMIGLATSLGISQFLLIQWVAPFLSEFPEKTSAFYWASKIKTAPLALMNLISSKLAQWTILLAIIPVIFSISIGHVSSIPLSNFTKTELMLTIANSFYAAIVLMKLRFNWFEAITLFLLWIVQFIFISLRPVLIWVTFGFVLLELIIYKKELLKALTGFKHVMKKHVLA